jgi:hypothetical protein
LSDKEERQVLRGCLVLVAVAVEEELLRILGTALQMALKGVALLLVGMVEKVRQMQTQVGQEAQQEEETQQVAVLGLMAELEARAR